MDDVRKLKTYVWHGDKCFFVSTIERESSAMVQPPAPRFNETLAWNYDWDRGVRGDIVAQDGEGEACDQHTRMVEQLYVTGKYVEDGEL